jgi:DNA-binding NarL/FixJ family response regulator
VVIIDADAPGVHLPRLIKKVFATVPTTNVVVVGDQPDVATAVAAVRAGAAAWSDRTTSVERLVDVMLGVHHGEAWFPPALLRAMLRALALSAADGAELEPGDGGPQTAARDAEMLERLARGTTTEDVAREFGVSAESVYIAARRAMRAPALHSIPPLSSVRHACQTASAGGPTPTD